jgi:hypothetical protein
LCGVSIAGELIRGEEEADKWPKLALRVAGETIASGNGFKNGALFQT